MAGNPKAATCYSNCGPVRVKDGRSGTCSEGGTFVFHHGNQNTCLSACPGQCGVRELDSGEACVMMSGSQFDASEIGGKFPCMHGGNYRIGYAKKVTYFDGKLRLSIQPAVFCLSGKAGTCRANALAKLQSSTRTTPAVPTSP